MGDRKRNHDGTSEPARPAKRALSEHSAKHSDEAIVDALTATQEHVEPRKSTESQAASTDADASVVDPEDGLLRCWNCYAALEDGDTDCRACKAQIVYCFSCNNTTDPLGQVCQRCLAVLDLDSDADEDVIVCPTCDATLEGSNDDWCPYCDEVVDDEE